MSSVGRRILLRRPIPRDLEVLLELRNNPELQRLILRGPVEETQNSVQEWIQRCEQDDTRELFIIACAVTKRCIGFVQIADIDRKRGLGRLGICLSPDEQGKGLATEAIDELEQYAALSLGLHLLKLEVLCSNERAVRLYRRIGFLSKGTRMAQPWEDQPEVEVLDMEKRLPAVTRLAG